MGGGMASVSELVKEYRETGSRASAAGLHTLRLEIAELVRQMAAEDFLQFANQALLPLLNAIRISGIRGEPLAGIDSLMADALSQACDADPLIQAKGLITAAVLDSPEGFPAPTWKGLPPVLVNACFAELTAPPPMFCKVGQASRYTDQVRRVVRSLLEACRSGAVNSSHLDVGAVAVHCRGLWFDDSNLLELRRDMAALAGVILRSNGVQVDHDFGPRRPGPIRLGVLKNHWHPGTETSAMLAHLEGLDRQRFEVTAVLPDGYSPQTQAFCAEHGVAIDALPENIGLALERLRALDLDIFLVGCNTVWGLDLPGVLTHCRVARRQVLTTMCPTTSGSPYMDAFLTGRLNERADAQADYSEALLCIPGSINRYRLDGARPAAAPRQPDGRLRLVSGANLHKLVPELLELWLDLLRALPQATLTLFPFNPNWAGTYEVTGFLVHLRMMAERAGVGIDRLEVLPPVDGRGGVLDRLAQCDLYLDSFPYSGGVSIADPLEAALPAVVMRCRQARGRQSAALFEELGLDELIADGIADYRRIVAEMAFDPAKRTRLGIEARQRWLALDQTLDIGPALESLLEPIDAG